MDKKKQQGVAKIEISPKRSVIREGEQNALTAVGLDGKNEVVQGAAFNCKEIDERRKSPELRLQNGLFEPGFAGNFIITAESSGVTAQIVITVKNDLKLKAVKELEKLEKAQAEGKNRKKQYLKDLAEVMPRQRPVSFNNSSRMSQGKANELKSKLLPLEKSEPKIKGNPTKPLKKSEPMKKTVGCQSSEAKR